MRPPRRLCVVAAVVVGCAALAAGGARADGDPASDVLLEQNVYVPYQAPSKSATEALEQAVGDVYAHGSRIKVALIWSVTDMGAIPSLYGLPSDYARFLATELGYWYVGPLLVVMPMGFGVYDVGRPKVDVGNALGSLPVSVHDPDDLAAAATTAVQRLRAAGALRSPDIRAPLVTVYPASATRGKQATLRFDLFDDSGRSSAVVRIYERNALLAKLVSPQAFQIGTRHVGVRWLVPRRLRSRQLRFCVVAFDPAGNRSQPACAPFLRVS